MHAKISEGNIHARKYDVIVDPDVILCVPTLPSPSCFKNPSMPHTLIVLQEKYKSSRV